MSVRRLLALAAAAALAACHDTAPTPGLNLAEPSAIAVFRGYAAKDPTRVRPYIAIANTGANDLAIVDGIDDSMVPGPFPLRGLVYPVPDRPALLASARLGDDEQDDVQDDRPDLLVAVSSGASSLQVISTWTPDGDIVGVVDFREHMSGPGGDVLALAALDPQVAGTAEVVALLSGRRVAVATFHRVALGAPDPNAIDTTSVQVRVSAQLPFQPVAVAVSRNPATPRQVWVATRDDLGGGIFGVAGLDVGAMVNGALPAITNVNVGFPTRLVGAAWLKEALTAPVPPPVPPATVEDSAAGWAALTPVERVYAVLDESACGVDAAIACGLVALDPGGGLLADPVAPSSSIVDQAPWRPALPIPGPLAMATSGLPAYGPPADLVPELAGTAPSLVRMVTGAGSRATGAVAAVASTDGHVWYVDLSRWELPGGTLLQSSMTPSVVSLQPSGQRQGTQWLVLEEDPADASSVIVPHTSSSELAAAVEVTPGYTPTETWTVVKEGILPNLTSRRAEAGMDGTGLWLALQTPGGNGGVVRVWDPTLGIQANDIAVIDPVGLGTCGQFEAEVDSVEPPRPSPNAPGGFLRLTERITSDPANASWNQCVQRLRDEGSFGNLSVTIRAGDFVLTRGTGTAARVVGRPQVRVSGGPPAPFSLLWANEAEGACSLPPAEAWPPSGDPPACDAACRARCDELIRIRNARRIGYVPERCRDGTTCRWTFPNPNGPALRFKLALEAAGVPAPRDLTLRISTTEGRAPFRIGPTTAAGDDARAVVPFDRSPWNPAAGIRFLVPYPAGSVLDGSPSGSGAHELR